MAGQLRRRRASSRSVGGSGAEGPWGQAHPVGLASCWTGSGRRCGSSSQP